MIEYTSEIGWRGVLNKHGVTVWDEKRKQKNEQRQSCRTHSRMAEKVGG